MLKDWLTSKNDNYLRAIFDKKLEGKKIAKNKLPRMGSDKQDYVLFCKDYDNQIKIIRRKISNGNYQFSPFLLTEILDGSKARPIIQASIRDSFLQQIIINYLEENFFSQFYQKSYAYQAGKSPLQAVKQVKKNIRNGLIWTYDADLSNFFGSLDHNILLNLIEKYYPLDKELGNIIRRFIKTSLIKVPSFSEKYIKEKLTHKNTTYITSKPQQGIPQGGILSGFLANLYLHDFDLILEKECNSDYIRYADDFIVQAKSEEEIKRISNLVKKELSALKVNLHPIKTHICCEKTDGNYERIGFKFLGFIFKNGVVTIKEKNLNKLTSIFNTIIIHKTLDSEKSDVFEIYDISNYKMKLIKTYTGSYQSIPIKGILLSEAQWNSGFCFQFYIEKINKFFTSFPMSEKPYEKYCWFDYFYLSNDNKQLNYLTYLHKTSLKKIYVIRYGHQCSDNDLKRFGYRSFKNRFYRHVKYIKGKHKKLDSKKA